MKTKFFKRTMLIGALCILGIFAIPFAMSMASHEARPAACMAGIPLLGCVRKTGMRMEAPEDVIGGGGGGNGGGNSIDDDVNSLMASIDEVYAKANATLAGLPPLEQYEAASDLSYGLRSLKAYGQQLVDMTASMKQKITAIHAKVTSKITAQAKVTAEANAETALLASGLYVKKTDADAALNQAVSAKETEVKQGFEAARQKEQTVIARRGELVTKKILPLALANAISAEIVGADNFETTIETLKKDRFPLIKGAGLDPEKAVEFTAEIFALPMTDEGKTQVQTRCDGVKKLIGATASGGSAAATASREFPVGGGNGDEAGKPVRIF